jgi:hypothetical protein
MLLDISSISLAKPYSGLRINLGKLQENLHQKMRHKLVWIGYRKAGNLKLMKNSHIPRIMDMKSI